VFLPVRLEVTPAVAAGFVCIALAFAGEALAGHLAWERQAILSGELWRLWSAHAVHFSPRHALVDTIALAALTVLAERLAGARMAWTVLLAAPPAISLGLLAALPDMQEYRGASGLAVAMAVLCGGLFWTRCGARGRLLLVALAVLLLAKTAAEAWQTGLETGDRPPFQGETGDRPPFQRNGGLSPVSTVSSGVVVAWQALVLGAGRGQPGDRPLFQRNGGPSPVSSGVVVAWQAHALGAGCALALLGWQRLRRKSPMQGGGPMLR
jgi:rhomboid family GlyGly-CTERM serine protease